MSTPLTDKGSERRAQKTWCVLTRHFKPSARDIAVFFVCSAIMVFRVPMPVEAASSFTYSHPWLSLITLFPILVWLAGAYSLGALGLIIWIARFFLLALRRWRSY